MGTLVDDRGRVTLPQRLRDELGLQPGTEVQAERVEQGILIRPVLTKKAFIQTFEGCVDSRTARTPKIDPLEVKRIWEPLRDHD